MVKGSYHTATAELATKSYGREIASEWCGAEKCNFYEEKETPELGSGETLGMRVQKRGLG